MHKSFSTEKPKDLSFDISGESFVARQVPGWLFVEFARLAESSSEAEQASATIAVFEHAMDADTFEHFRDFCKDPANGVSIAVLMEVMTYLCEGSVSERPTQPPSGSARGRARTAPTSKAGSSSQASNGKASASTKSATSATRS